MIALITGGTRSGKSSYALQRVQPRHAHPVFIATAQAFDDEMTDRISRHRTDRGERFATIEEPLDLAGALLGLPPETDIAVVDCLTVWLGNLYHHHDCRMEPLRESIDSFVAALKSVRCDLILVTNEVGWGIVPENAMARSFRDLAGNLNRRVAEVADEVVLCVCGIPMIISVGPRLS